jgi:serine/threonine-protein kinase
VDAERLKAFVASANGDDGLTLKRLGEKAVSAGLLTPFQTRELIAGRADQLKLNAYRLIEKLGAGGMGDVYLAVHTPTAERRAIKLLAEELHDDPVSRMRFDREARAAIGLDHPHIVRVYEYDSDQRPPYLVMEYVDGISLQAAVALSGTFTAEAAAECGRQVADGLQHAWEAGFVHRDIKPANLLLDRGGRMKVLDLGIARQTGEVGLTITGKDSRSILGTVDYLAPEQALDSSDVDCRADVYSLGATLYFLLAGHPPFRDGNPAHRLLMKQQGDPPLIHTLRPDIPVGLSEVIGRMLCRRPEDRYQLPSEAADALRPWACGEPLPGDLFERVEKAEQNGGTPSRSRLAGPSTSSAGHTNPMVVNQFAAADRSEVSRPQPDLKSAPATSDTDTPLPNRLRPSARPGTNHAARVLASRRVWVISMTVSLFASACLAYVLLTLGS